MNASTSHIDDSLFADLQKGNEQAFEVIFNKYYPMLCAYALQFVERHDAEEVVQDIMLWLWENRASFNLKSSLSQYLFRSVRNKCLTRIDRLVLQEKIITMLYDRFRDQFEDPGFYDINDLTDRIGKAIGNLPETYRTALEMNRFQHKTYKEIGDALGISSKTVDYRIQKALKLLRIELKDFITVVVAIFPILIISDYLDDRDAIDGKPDSALIKPLLRKRL